MKFTISFLIMMALAVTGCSQVIPPGQPGYVNPDSGSDGTGSGNGSGNTGTGGDGNTGSGGDGSGSTGTGSSPSPSPSSSPTQSPSVTQTTPPAPTYKLVVLSAAQIVTAGTCSSPVVIKSENASDNSSYSVPSNTVVTLTGNNLKFYSDQNCTLPITTVTIPAQNSIASLYFSGTVAGSSVLVISASNFNQGSEGQTIAAATPSSIFISVQPSNGTIQNQIFKTQPVVSVLDQYSNLATNATGTVTATPYLDAACTSAASGDLSDNTSSLTSGNSTFFDLSYGGSTAIYINFTYNSLSVCSNLVTIFSELMTSISSFTIDQEQTINLLQYLSGGAPPYTFSISSKTSLNPTIDSSGDYTAGQNLRTYTESDVILVKDQLGQSTSITAEIVTALLVSTSATSIVGNGTIQLTVSGGIAPYAYSVSSGGGVISSAGLYTAPPTPGSAVLLVTDSDGTTQNVSVTVIAPLVVSPSAIVVLEDGNQQLTATGGVAPYTFSVATGSGTIDDTGNFSAPSSEEVDSILVQDSSNPPNSVYATLTVNGGPADEIDLTQQPAAGNSGNTLSMLPNLEALNQNNEVDNGFNQTVTVAVYDSNCQYPVAGATAQITPATFTNGILTATNLIVTGSGDVTLQFTAGGFTTCSNDFIVTVLPTVLESNAATNCFINNQQMNCWGSNANEQLAINSSSKLYSYTPVAITGVSGSVSSVIETEYSTCVIDGNDFKCWGSNASGDFGVSPSIVSQTYSPFTVNGMDVPDLTTIARGDQTVCAAINDSVVCWGDDSNHQLGRGTPNATNTINCTTITDLANTCISVNGCDTESDTCDNLGSRTECQANTACLWNSSAHSCGLAGADSCVGTGTDTCSTIYDPTICSNIPACAWDSIQALCYDPTTN
jgi:hypothetical protein